MGVDDNNKANHFPATIPYCDPSRRYPHRNPFGLLDYQQFE